MTSAVLMRSTRFAPIATPGNDARVGERLMPRSGERDDRAGAQADVGGLAV